MLIWYGNIPEETVYFYTRLHQYPVMFYLNIGLNFALPFLVLLRNDTKRKYGTLMFISCVLVFSHWLDFFLMLKPGILHTAQELSAGAEGGASHMVGFTPGFTLPGFTEVGTFIGFLGLFFFFVFNRLEKASLVPRRDPYLMESISHHT
jgi:Ni/Fe-hydrogenase subunit HybB-like protein